MGQTFPAALTHLEMKKVEVEKLRRLGNSPAKRLLRFLTLHLSCFTLYPVPIPLKECIDERCDGGALGQDDERPEEHEHQDDRREPPFLRAGGMPRSRTGWR